MPLTIDYSNVMAENLGNEHGLSFGDLETLVDKGKSIRQQLNKMVEEQQLGFFRLPYEEKLADEIESYAELVKERYEYYVHNGIGGSALGPIALQTSLRGSYYNLTNAPKMFFPDNVDPDWLSELLSHIDVSKTLFHVVSKSGGTAETAATTLYFLKHLREKLGDNFYKNILFTTDPVKGLLNEIAREYPIKCFRIPADVGGRFSVLSPVGLVSAAISGVDVKALLAGAREMAAICDRENLMENPAFLFAAIHVLYMKKGKNISVMMPYSNRLKDMADWYCQLWAESLGKRFDIEGNIVEVGQTPVKALGATDQHSQIQLYVEGPNDKVISFLEVENFANNDSLQNYFSYIKEFDYFNNKTLAQLLNSEKSATELALTNNQRPNLTIRFPEIREETIGAYFFLMEAATAFAGGFLNINAFDQPGVEEGKIATYALMGRKGYEKKNEEIQKLLEAKKRYAV